MTGPVRIGVIDGAVTAPAGCIEAARDFIPPGEAGAPRGGPGAGHGSAVAALVLGAAPAARLLCARAFDPRGVSSPARVAAALDWLCEERADLVLMSFGLGADRKVLAEAVARALADGPVLVAAAPARGRPAFPAAYRGVIAVTGDARCAPGEVSDLAGGGPAEFGTWCASPERHPEAALSGASVAAAHFCGLAAAWLDAGGSRDRAALRNRFAAAARYRGPERRTGAE